MLKQFYKKNNPAAAGVDISCTSVKLLTLVRKGHTYEINAFGECEIPSGAVVEKEIKDPDAVAKALRVAHKRSRIATTNVAVALADSSVITKIIKMEPGIGDALMEEQVLFEADKYVPYSLDEVRLDFQILGPCSTDPQWNQVLLAASRAQTVESYIAAVNLAGLTLKIVDIESFVLNVMTSYLSSCPSKKNQTAHESLNKAVVDIGDSRTSLIVYQNDIPVFIRCEPFGGSLLTQKIVEAYGLSYNEAREKKLSSELPKDYAEKILQPFIALIVQNIGRSLQVLFSSTEIEHLNKLFLTGGSSNLPGLNTVLNQETGIEIEVLDPLKKFKLLHHLEGNYLRKIAPSLLMSCGLALRGFPS